MRTLRWSFLLAVLGVAAVAAAAPADLPKVNAQFVFEASMYLTNEDLGDAGRKQVADTAASTFIREAQKPAHYPFINWTTGDGSARNQLTIVITQQADGRDQRVDLEFRGGIGANPVTAATASLYRWTDGKHANDADRLTLDVTGVIIAHIEDIRSTFALRVPLTTEVSFVDGLPRVLVEVPPSKLHADADASTLLVSFVGTKKPLQDNMILSNPSPYHSLPKPGSAQSRSGVACLVQKFDFDGMKVDASHEWSPGFPVFFSKNVKVLGVTFASYRYTDIFTQDADQEVEP